MKVQITRSWRKTISARVLPDMIEVKAPIWATQSQIQLFLDMHKDKIQKETEKQQACAQRRSSIPKLTWAELEALAVEASHVIPKRVQYYASLAGVQYGRITIRSQRTRWGSCSANKNLSFNCILMLAPPEVLDGVVVHEICHLKEMNHSKQFYEEVYRILPDYDKRSQWLKDNGVDLLYRIPDPEK